MYLPEHFREQRPEPLHALVRAHPFATLVTQAGGELAVDHLPLLFDAADGEHGVLRGHVARANPLWRLLGEGADAVAVFHGAQGYVSPGYYASKREHGKVVPTWNYAVVHAHGRVRAVDDREWLRDLVTRLTTTHEAAQAQPWQVGDAPADFVDRNLAMIVGLEMPVQRLVGKWKMSQNRSPADRAGVVEGLRSRGDANALALAALVGGDEEAGRARRPAAIRREDDP